jgi:hypothetical protein
MLAAVRDLRLRDDNVDVINKLRIFQNLQGMGHYRFSGKEQILLVDLSPHPLPYSGGWNQCNNLHVGLPVTAVEVTANDNGTV